MELRTALYIFLHDVEDKQRDNFTYTVTFICEVQNLLGPWNSFSYICICVYIYIYIYIYRVFHDLGHNCRR